jgi:hypothetical protein
VGAEPFWLLTVAKLRFGKRALGLELRDRRPVTA